MANQKIRIKLKSYEHKLIDQSAERIVETANHPAPDGKGDRHHPSRCAQVQGQPRTVRAPHP